MSTTKKRSIETGEVEEAEEEVAGAAEEEIAMEEQIEAALKKKGIIKDAWVSAVLKKSIPECQDMWPPAAVKVGEDYLRWDSESMDPVKLCERLFGKKKRFEVEGNAFMTEEEYGFDGKLNQRWKGRRDKFKEEVQELQQLMLENCGYKMFYKTSSRISSEDKTPRARLATGETVTLFCKRCNERDPKQWIALMRLKCMSEKEEEADGLAGKANDTDESDDGEELSLEGGASKKQKVGKDGVKKRKKRAKKVTDEGGGKRKFYLLLEEIFFHSCQGPKNAPWTEEKEDDGKGSGGEETCLENDGAGTYIAKSGGEGTFVGKLMEEAFKGWIDELHSKYPDPFKVAGGKTLPKGWSRINLDGSDPILDARFQIEMRTKADIPNEIDKVKFDQVVTWKVMTMVNKLGGARCFTEHYPLNYSLFGKPGQVCPPGSYPCEKTDHPVHLFVRNVFLVFGGGAATKHGKQSKKRVTVHQAPHADFLCKEYPEGVESCPLLNRLRHPFTFNTALGTQRKIHVEKGEYGLAELKVISKYETLVVSCDTAHWGECFTWCGDYCPSLHVVVESTRYPKSPEEVKMIVGVTTAMPRRHLYHVTPSGFSDIMYSLQQRIEDIVKHYEKTGLAVCEGDQKYVTKYREVFMGDDAATFKSRAAEDTDTSGSEECEDESEFSE